MWMLLALLLVQVSSQPCQTSPCGKGVESKPEGPPSLVVKVIDPVADVIPGAQVTIAPSGAKKPVASGHTDSDGYARFWVRPENVDSTYTVEVKEIGFKTKRLKGVRIPKADAQAPSAGLTVQLTLSGPGTLVD